MSEENKKTNACKLVTIGVIASLIMSFCAFVMSGITLLGSTGAIPQLAIGADLPISKKYDKGRSLEKAMKKDKPVVAFFYVDWCGFCQRFAPTFDAVSKNKDIKKKFSIAYINCDDPKNRELIEKYGIQGFPTVFVVDSKGEEKVQLKNEMFFAPTAQEDLVREIKEFLRPKK